MRRTAKTLINTRKREIQQERKYMHGFIIRANSPESECYKRRI